MRVLGYVLGACVVLAIVRAVAAVLVIALLIVIVAGAFAKPRETFRLLTVLIIASVVQDHGALVIAVSAALIVIGIIVSPANGE